VEIVEYAKLAEIARTVGETDSLFFSAKFMHLLLGYSDYGVFVHPHY